MTRSIALSLALALMPVAGLAQQAPPPDGPSVATPSPAVRAAMQQVHLQLEQYRVQTRTNMLSALTPQHRTAVATIVGQLALAPNPNVQAAAQQIDLLLAPAEKQSIVTIAQTAHANARALMRQQRAAIATTLSPDERVKMQEHAAKMEAFMQSHPQPADAVDAGEIVLRTLGSFGQPGFEMHSHPF